MANRDKGLVFDAGMLTMDKYLTDWLADSVKDSVRKYTFVRY